MFPAAISFLLPLETGTDNSCRSEEEGSAAQSQLLQEVLQPSLYPEQEFSQGTQAVVAHWSIVRPPPVVCVHCFSIYTVAGPT